MKAQTTQNHQSNLGKKKKTREIVLPDFKAE